MVKRIIILGVFALQFLYMHGQMNFYERGTKSLYWGISLSLNQSNFAIDRKPYSILNDTVRSVTSSSGPGFNLGLIGNWQLNKYIDIRAIPSMVFGEKIINFETQNDQQENRINTTYITLPVMLRFKSEPVKDWRIFVLGGLKYDYNIVPQEITLAEPNRIRLKKHGLSYEYGIGLQYFFQYFIFSPEIKFSHSFFNMLDSDQSNFNGNTMNGLFPRTLTLSLNFEG